MNHRENKMVHDPLHGCFYYITDVRHMIQIYLLKFNNSLVYKSNNLIYQWVIPGN